MWSIRFQELDCWKSDLRSQEGERRRNEENCNVKWITSLGQCDDRLTAGVCTFLVIDRGKNGAHSRMEA